MEFLQNRVVAAVLCLIMILAASLAGAGRSLSALRAQSEAVFELGGLEQSLGEIASQCYNITVIARRYLPENDKFIVETLQKREELMTASTPGEKSRAVDELVSAATTALRNTLESAPLSDQDRTLLQKCVVNIDSSMAIIAVNPYNDSAADFNRVLGSFPANILSPLTGVAPLELYK